MTGLIRSLHHVTATVGDAQADLTCFVEALGMRLVKKTVNFDNHNVYHFYYGDERGTPGTLMTTFPYAGWGVPAGTHGTGQVTTTSFSVPGGSLGVWRQRLRDRGYATRDVGERFGDEVLAFEDRSGLALELVATTQDARTPWVAEGLTAKTAVRGLSGASLTVRTAGPTIQFLTKILGWEVVDEAEARTRLAVKGDTPGHRLDVIETPDAPAGVNGLGTVHHVAMAVASAEDQLAAREELVGLGIPVTPVRDRQYFTSIYFREPGGVLYEIATIPPGFTLDEELSKLGADLKLPPWEESNRPVIVQGLAKVTY